MICSLVVWPTSEVACTILILTVHDATTSELEYSTLMLYVLTLSTVRPQLSKFQHYINNVTLFLKIFNVFKTNVPAELM